MTTSAAEKVARVVPEKKEEKIEKRKALGRGLESLLPGPRVVSGGAGDDSVNGSDGVRETMVPRFARDDMSEVPSAKSDGVRVAAAGPQATEEMDARRAGVSAPHEPLPLPEV